MNVKINKQQHERLTSKMLTSHIFGSRLHGTNTEDSDTDYIGIISDEFYDEFNTLAKYLPNIHSWQYDDVENNTQWVWLTVSQFWRNLFSGDGNMIADVVILHKLGDTLFLTRTHKVIKGYLGVARRDLKLHPRCKKKRFHAMRSLMFAEKLIDGELPVVEDIKSLREKELMSREELLIREKELRAEINMMLDSGSLDLYPVFEESDDLVQIMTNSNNIREFKYTKS